MRELRLIDYLIYRSVFQSVRRHRNSGTFWRAFWLTIALFLLYTCVNTNTVQKVPNPQQEVIPI